MPERPKARFDFLTLLSPDMERSAEFYTALGVSFNTEQHLEGPIHYSTQLQESVLEIYPAKESGVMLGFYVDSLEEATKRLAEIGAKPTKKLREDAILGKNVTFRDPDGRLVMLREIRKLG